MAHRIGVMYLGRLVELAPAEQLYASPQHPYTQALLSAMPIPHPQREKERQRVKLTGEIPSPDREYPGCAFADRCPVVEERCRTELVRLPAAEHAAACIKPGAQPIKTEP
jgi:oligopeptide transport system ATP-binding protein